MIIHLIEFTFVLAIVGIIISALMPKLKTASFTVTPEDERTAMRPTHTSTQRSSQPPSNPLETATMRCSNIPFDITSPAILLEVPNLVPGHSSEGWSSQRTVIAGFRVHAPFPENANEVYDLIELDGGYCIMGRPNGVFLLQKLDLTEAEISAINRERDEALKRGDGAINNFKGTSWSINSIAGDIPGRQSSIQMVTQAKGQQSRLVRIAEGRSHRYFDLLAYSAGTNTGWLYVFASDNVWYAFVGRQLTDVELRLIRVL